MGHTQKARQFSRTWSRIVIKHMQRSMKVNAFYHFIYFVCQSTNNVAVNILLPVIFICIKTFFTPSHTLFIDNFDYIAFII